jgi:hypothetical protein
MNDVTRTKEEIVKSYIVVDKDGEHFDMNSRREARETAERWNKDDPDMAPHRVFEVVWREVLSP